MYRQLKQTACPQTPQGLRLDQRSVLKRRITTPHPDKELALQGHLSSEWSPILKQDFKCFIQWLFPRRFKRVADILQLHKKSLLNPADSRFLP